MTLAAQPSIDPAFWPVEDWRELQAQRLARQLKQAAKSGLYKGLSGVPACHALNLDEILRQLPLTTKDNLAAAGRSAIAVSPEQVREWVCTSGTAAKPLDVPLTESDLERLAENEARALGLAGIARGDLVILAVAMDRLFVAGLAYWLGAQKLGATCVRVGPQIASQPQVLAELLARFSAPRSFLITVPSFLTQAPGDFPGLTAIVAIGESIRNPDLSYNVLGQNLHGRFRCPILSTYANTETCTTFAEGSQCVGGHLNPELGLVEILDDAGNAVAPGTSGEVTITPLGLEALPLLRFRTGDIAALQVEACPCGRTTPRLGPIVGRRQQQLKIRGTSLYPGAILETLRATPEVADCVLVAEHDQLRSDQLTAHLHLSSDTPAVRRALEERLRALLRVLPEIRYTDAAEIQRLKNSTGARKPTPFIDRRSKTA